MHLNGGFIEDFIDNTVDTVKSGIDTSVIVAKMMYTAPITVSMALLNGGLPAAGKQLESDVLKPGLRALGNVAPILPYVPYGYVGSLVLVAAKLREQQVQKAQSESEKADIQAQIDAVEAKIAAIKKTPASEAGYKSAMSPPVDKKIPWGTIATGAGIVATVLLIS